MASSGGNSWRWPQGSQAPQFVKIEEPQAWPPRVKLPLHAFAQLAEAPGEQRRQGPHFPICLKQARADGRIPPRQQRQVFYAQAGFFQKYLDRFHIEVDDWIVDVQDRDFPFLQV